MLWLLFLGLTTLAWTAPDIIFKLLGNQMNYFLALFIIAISQVVIAIPFLIYAMSTGELTSSVKGYYLSASIGVFLAFGSIFFFYTFKYGTPLSIAMPVYGIGSLIVGALAGVFIFKESLSPMVLVGLVLGTISIVLLTIK